MLQRSLIYLLIIIGMLSCTSLDVDKISEELEYKPNLSLPLGKLLVQYDDVNDLPISLPNPLDAEEVNWHETDTVYFNLQSSISERKYIVTLMLQFDITNRYPANMAVELFYIDLMGYAIALTPEPIHVLAADIDADGKVTREKHTDTYPYQLFLSDEQIDELLYAEQLIIKAEVNGLLLTDPVVNSFEEYSINTAVGVQAQIDYSINNL
ncbi:hypothetical protein [Carboxylicivirga marina]|uniref:Uncharacterized protein n=1 Tax=Carboxylicivirga marina TaxID=2800988 RepID=A0ABS1HE69_9BACT|nr:hypothetical protein [Carboxylicivirga marina]MBK3515921.1 hypothetical protein [Carboxylicivirga marina]